MIIKHMRCISVVRIRDLICLVFSSLLKATVPEPELWPLWNTGILPMVRVLPVCVALCGYVKQLGLRSQAQRFLIILLSFEHQTWKPACTEFAATPSYLFQCYKGLVCPLSPWKLSKIVCSCFSVFSPHFSTADIYFLLS